MITVSVAPLSTVAPRFVPAVTSVPPDEITVFLAAPPRPTASMPPEDTTTSMAVPPDRTVSEPPLLTVVWSVVPPDGNVFGAAASGNIVNDATQYRVAGCSSARDELLATGKHRIAGDRAAADDSREATEVHRENKRAAAGEDVFVSPGIYCRTVGCAALGENLRAAIQHGIDGEASADPLHAACVRARVTGGGAGGDDLQAAAGGDKRWVDDE